MPLAINDEGCLGSDTEEFRSSLAQREIMKSLAGSRFSFSFPALFQEK